MWQSFGRRLEKWQSRAAGGGGGMKAISLWEPWASLWCSGVKVHETRSWSTLFRGLVAVHAAKRWTGSQADTLSVNLLGPAIEAAGGLVQRRFEGRLWASTSHGPDSLGCIVGVVDLVECRQIGLRLSWESPTAIPETWFDNLCGDWAPGRYAWRGESPVLLERPIPCRGAQGFFRLPLLVETELQRQLGRAT
jgi:hypothetical protein